MSSFTYQDIHFHFEVEGHGFPLLFFHGLGGDLTQGKTILEHVPGFEKVYMESRGHGSTYPLGPGKKLNFGQFAGDAVGLANHLGYKKFIAGGLSMGSATAIRLALTFPNFIEALILIRPAWMNEPYPNNLRNVVWIGELLQKYGPEKGKRIFMEREDFTALKQASPAVADSLLGAFDEPNASNYALRLIKIPISVPFEKKEDLSSIQIETLILGTDRDPTHPLWMAKELADRIPKAKLAIVTSKSEDLNRHYEELSNHINKFLNKYRETSEDFFKATR